VDGGDIIPFVDFASSVLNNSNIVQTDDSNTGGGAGTVSGLQQRIKLSRSLKALKSNSKRRHISKDMKQSIDQIAYLNHNLPSAINLGHGDLRLFSIYGVPP